MEEKEKMKREEMEDTTAYGEFVCTFFAWLAPEEQDQRAQELDEMTKKK